jgi:hypothetical protein
MKFSLNSHRWKWFYFMFYATVDRVDFHENMSPSLIFLSHWVIAPRPFHAFSPHTFNKNLHFRNMKFINLIFWFFFTEKFEEETKKSVKELETSIINTTQRWESTITSYHLVENQQPPLGKRFSTCSSIFSCDNFHLTHINIYTCQWIRKWWRRLLKKHLLFIPPAKCSWNLLSFFFALTQLWYFIPPPPPFF